jgi:hypothetical protein
MTCRKQISFYPLLHISYRWRSTTPKHHLPVARCLSWHCPIYNILPSSEHEKAVAELPVLTNIEYRGLRRVCSFRHFMMPLLQPSFHPQNIHRNGYFILWSPKGHPPTRLCSSMFPRMEWGTYGQKRSDFCSVPTDTHHINILRPNRILSECVSIGGTREWAENKGFAEFARPCGLQYGVAWIADPSQMWTLIY